MSNYVSDSFKVIKKTNIAVDCYDFLVYAPKVSEIAVAGQFAQIKVKGFFLNRPISICEVDKENKTIRFVFSVRGKGTKELSNVNEGDFIEMLAPLGKGFTLDKRYKNIVVVGGGIGVPPMLEVAKFYKEKATAINGFSSASMVILENDFIINNVNIVICTDDGSKGKKGFTTTALEEYVKDNKVDMIYSCGPNIMLSTVANIAKKYDIPCEVSLEEHMACGVGACLVCACKTVKNGEDYFARVCKDGPVFNANDVVF